MARILIARFHSLGDVILVSGIAHALIEEGNVVDIATRRAFFPVLEGLAVGRLLDPDALRCLREPYDKVVDLQANRTSRRLLDRWSTEVERQNSRSAQRRWTVFWGRRRPRAHIPHVVERYGEAAGLRSHAGALRPRLVVTDGDRRAASGYPLAGGVPREPLIGLAIGGSRAMKRWPEDSFGELERRLRAEGFRTVKFVPPVKGETEPEADDSVVRAPLGALKAVAASCRVIVTNDSGIMHLAVGLGVRVVAIFGSTVREFGFSPLGPHDQIVSRNLSCRPCAPHGARFCWLGHRRCLRDIEAGEVHAAVLAAARDSERGDES
jgi:heptosyltransferase-2